MTAALLGSLLVSLTVVPVLSCALLRWEGGPGRRDRPRSRPRSRLQRGYRLLLRAALYRPGVALLVAGVIWDGTALVPRQNPGMSPCRGSGDGVSE